MEWHRILVLFKSNMIFSTSPVLFIPILATQVIPKNPHLDKDIRLQYLKGVYEQEGVWLFMWVGSGRTRGNGFKLRQGRFRFDIRTNFFTHRVMMHWNRRPKEVVDAPSLKAFKTRLDAALGSLVLWLATLPTAGGLKLDDL